MNRCSVALLSVVMACSLWPTQAAVAVPLIGVSPNNLVTNVLGIETDPFSVSTNGVASGRALSGLDRQPGTGVLFASSGFAGGNNPGSLYIVNGNTGASTLIGASGFDAVPGLAFGLSGTLYGSASSGGTQGGYLATIDPSTGAGTLVGAYGTIGGNVVRGLDGLASHPTTGVLYASSGRAFDGSAGDIFSINKTTGAATLLGSLSQAGGGSGLSSLAGLAFDDLGQLFGSVGFGGGEIISIDLGTFQFSYLGDASSKSVSGLVVVPEPSTFLLLGTALLAIGRIQKAPRGLLSGT